MKKNSRFIKILVAVGVVAASAGVSLGVTSLVSADTATSSDIVTMAGPAHGEGPHGVTGHNPKMGPRSEALAEMFGMTQDELRDAMHSGKSLATIAEEKNVDLSKVTDLLVSEFSAHLDEKVASGKHTREEADEKLAAFTENVDQMVTMTPPARGEGQRGGKGRGGHGGHHRHGEEIHEMQRPSGPLGELEGSGSAFNA